MDLAGDSPLIVTEGEKKALALWQAGFQVVGIGGVWNWFKRGGELPATKESRPIADLDLVNWRRPVTILFDSDGHDNPLVRLAAFRLARELPSGGQWCLSFSFPWLRRRRPGLMISWWPMGRRR